MGADCVLLILACLSQAQARELEAAAEALKMAVLIEVHTAEELDRALDLNSELIGVNNRNLKTFQTEINTSLELTKDLPASRLAISESGLASKTELDRLAAGGVRCFLIGESLMRQADVAQATRALLHAPI